MGQRRERLDKRLARQETTRRKNSLRKEAARVRQDACMMNILKQNDPEAPLPSSIQNWLSQKLGIKASRITAEDIKSFLAAAS